MQFTTCGFFENENRRNEYFQVIFLLFLRLSEWKTENFEVSVRFRISSASNLQVNLNFMYKKSDF